MFNKKWKILILLAIFCIAITISSVSANEDDSNLTSDESHLDIQKQELNTLEINSDNNDLISEHDEDVYSSNPIDANETKYLKIMTNDYKTYDNAQNFTVQLNPPASNVYYKIYDSKHDLKYEFHEYIPYNNKQIMVNFQSNLQLFKNLPDGNYICFLSTGNYLGYDSALTFADLTWNVTKITPKKISTSTRTTSVATKSNHHAKYIKVGKYKVKVWSDDSKNTQKNKVIKYLKKHVKKGHTFKKHGYRFKVSAKMYRKILYYKKYGYDGKMGYANFKVKTNKYYTYKEPIYKTYKVTKKVWKYKKVLRSEYWSWDGGSEWQDYNTWEKYVKKGWTWYGTSDKEKTYSDYSYYSAHYYKLKKKVKKTITKEKIVGYKKVKLRVYAYGVESHFKVGVQFWGLKHGQKYCPITNYHMF